MLTNYNRRETEAGQTLILGVLALTVIFIMGAVAVDIGLWLSERRGAQTDADFAALAGAWELLDPAGSAGDASFAASANFAANDEQGNATVANLGVDNSCFEQTDDDAVIVDAEHQSVSLFASIFNVVAPDIGAHAKACAGATNAPTNLVPFEIDNDTPPCFVNEEPVFTALCPLEFGGNSNPRGIIDMLVDGDYCSDASGSDATKQLIEFGPDGTCLINDPSVNNCNPKNNGPWYDCVSVRTGDAQSPFTGAVIDGAAARIAREGECDAVFGNGDGFDDLDETVELIFDNGNGDPTDDLYHSRDCEPATAGPQISPRLVTITVLGQYPTGSANRGHPISAFAGFYLVGCDESASQTDPSLIDRDCDATNGPPPPGCPGRDHCVVYGRFVKLIVGGSGVGPPSSATTLFSIALME